MDSPNKKHRIAAEALRWRCDLGNLPFETTEEVEPISGVVGQDSAIEALRFGLECSSPGQNVFVRGLTGTGRVTLVTQLLHEIRPTCPLAEDRCYVHNFDDPERPKLISLPRGQASLFHDLVDELADFIRDDLASALQSETTKTRIAALEQANQARVRAAAEPFEQALRQAGLGLAVIRSGSAAQTRILPLHEGKTVTPEEFDLLHTSGKISDEQYQAVRSGFEQFAGQLEQLTGKIREITKEHAAATRKLLQEEARSLLAPMTRQIQTRLEHPGVQQFLDGLITDLVENRLTDLGEEGDPTRLYRVNVILKHEGDECPIIVETTPTVANLIGGVDHEIVDGRRALTNHMMIREGSLLRADGGYLLMEARDVVTEPGAWKALLRTLRTGCLEISTPESASPLSLPTLKPEPIEVNVKVILIGDGDLYYLLDRHDPEFPYLFKVLAEFDSVIPRDEQALKHYAAVIARIAKEEKLLPFDKQAVAQLIEHGARIAAHQRKLTSRFGRLADIAREASFVAGKRSAQVVSEADVRETVRRTKRRADLSSRRFRELLADGTIQVRTQGNAVGQINGLAVVHAGPLTYGFPARITATIGAGTAGVINIEREAALSGSIHTKGFYILSGLLRCLLRADHPLAFDASIAFEQSYGGIDGDSASGAEICCLLSALTGLPLRQDLSMTGAIDQMGNILAIGGVNEKIEGFFDTCSDLGLTGTQGVVIPKSNAGELMLRHDVVEACREGRFHVYAVEQVQDALEILTGIPAGARDETGRYPPESVLGQAVRRARHFWEMATPERQAGRDAGDRSTPPS